MARRDAQSSQQRDALYLRDITEAADAAAGFLAGITEQQFLESDLLQSAVLQKLSVIGEAATRLSPECKAAATHIPWAAITGLRNVAVHAYFSVQWPIIWETATKDVPLLRAQVQALRDADTPPAS